jgi:uncharacterized damage-inducible protein DinB
MPALAEYFAKELEWEARSARAHLEAVPFDKLDFKLHEKSMPLGQLARHLLDMPDWGVHTLAADSLSMGPEDMLDRDLGTREETLARWDADIAKFREMLAGTSDAAMAAHWKMLWDGQPMIDQPRWEVLRMWVFNHLIHHRAQLGYYLRALGVAVPGAYGPTADEQQPGG